MDLRLKCNGRGAPHASRAFAKTSAGLLIGVMGLGAGCNFGPRYKSIAEETLYADDPVHTLLIENDVGDVTVLADASATEFRAELRKVGKGRSPADAEEALSEIEITFAPSADDPDVLEASVWHPRSRRGKQYQVDWVITTPADISLSLVNDVGEIDVAGIGYGATIRNDVGDITAKEIGGGLTITSDVGDVRASASGPIEIKSDVGDVRVEALDAGAEVITVRTDVGDALVILPRQWAGLIDTDSDIGGSSVRTSGVPLRVFRHRSGRFEGEMGEDGGGSLLIRTDIGDARVRVSSDETSREMH